MSDLARIQKAVVQKLESLQRSGVRQFPRTELLQRPAARSKDTSPVRDVQVKKASAQVHPPNALKPELAVDATEASDALRILADEVGGCTQCHELASTRKQTVFGVGDPNARLAFFGEAPGADEDRLGEPFVGRAGQLLTKIIEACTLRRDDVYIMNVLKCRPPGNRNPTPEEAQHCRPFFERQLEIVKPDFICCLGAIAATTLLETSSSVGRLRGRFHDWRGIKVLVTYHPSYLLRNADAKKLVWADMKMLMKEMGLR